jgi:hypothetical protein
MVDETSFVPKGFIQFAKENRFIKEGMKLEYLGIQYIF